MGTLYLIRHGEVKWNREAAYVGSTDLPLDLTGRMQAERLTGYLESKCISAVYSSDLMRAYQTAEIIANRMGLPVHALKELREADYGEWEGVPEIEVPKLYPGIFEQWRDDVLNVRIPGGETFAELRDRAFPAFCRIAEAHPDGQVAIVAHKSTNRVILCCLLGVDVNTYRQLGQGNAAVNIIHRRQDGSFVVETINECCHLADH